MPESAWCWTWEQGGYIDSSRERVHVRFQAVESTTKKLPQYLRLFI